MQDIAILLERWQGRLELAGKAQRTREAYREEIARLVKWSMPRDVTELTRADLEDYLLARKRGGVGESSLGVIVCACKSFYRYIASNAADGLTSPTVRSKLQRTLTESEVEAVLMCIDTSTVKGKRDVAIVGLMLATGLRASEVCRLRLTEVDMERRAFRVVVKGGRENVRHFDEYAANLLAAWLAVRPGVARPEVQNLFVAIPPKIRSKQGVPLTRQGIKLLCLDLARRADIPRFTPHALRRTFATLATEYGCPSRLLQDAGGWSSVTMLEIYAKAVQLRAFDQYSPLIRLMKRGETG
jgi:site-specific recombinase XerD